MTQDPPFPDGTPASYSVGSVANGHMWTGTEWVPLRDAPPAAAGATPAYEPGMVANGFVWTGVEWSALPATASALGAWASHQEAAPSPGARKPLWRRWWVLAAVALILIVGIANISKNPASQNAGLSTSPSQTPVPATSASESPTSASPAASAVDPEANPTNTASVSTADLTPAPVPYGAKSSCRTGNPLANVYHPYRLQVVAACSTVSGIVKSVTHEDDGDYHIDIALDSAYKGMLNAGNITYQHGWLVVEIVPADEPGCTVGQPPRPATGTYNYGICTGARESPPAIGTHIWVTGPYVIDHWHNWAEIHPVWGISNTKPAISAPVPAPTPKPTATSTKSTVALRCSASMSNSTPSQYSTTSVLVRTGAGAQVSATANYKTTSTTNYGTADSSGLATIPFRISRATIGYQVIVDVSVSLAGQSASCSTSFTPQ